VQEALQKDEFPHPPFSIQEWLDEELPNRIRVLGQGKPYDAVVEFPSSLPDQERKKAFTANTKCLELPGGCKTAGASRRPILPLSGVSLV
jgi:hypothetical protein